MSEERINEGDSVVVLLAPGLSIGGIVKYKAMATGDCWIIENAKEVNYVQTFLTIIKLKGFPL